MKSLIVTIFIFIVCPLLVYFFKPDVIRISNKCRGYFFAELEHLNEIENRLSNFKKHAGFFQKKNELNKIADMLKLYFSDDDKNELLKLQKEIQDMADKYNNSEDYIRMILDNAKVFRKYLDFLWLVLGRQKNTLKIKIKTLFH